MPQFLCCSLCVTCSRDKPSIRDVPSAVLSACAVLSGEQTLLGSIYTQEWLYGLSWAIALALLWHPCRAAAGVENSVVFLSCAGKESLRLCHACLCCTGEFVCELQW